MPIAAQAQLTVVAEFPEKYFLENLAGREDGSILVTALNRNELWLVPAPAEGALVEPALVHTFEFNTMFVVEWRPDRFLVGVSDVYHTRDARLYEMDMRGWAVGQKAAPRLLLDFPEPKVGLNGGCLLAPNVLLAAGGPTDRRDVVSEQPECGPYSLAFGNQHARLHPAVVEAEQPLGLHARGGVNVVRRIQGRNVQVAVGSYVGVWIAGTARRET